MKKMLTLLAFLAILISFNSCKKDDSPSFVDDYNAPLTEEKGTEHAGNYFPLNEGYWWDYSGNQEIIGEMKVSGPGINETESIHESGPIYSLILVEPLTSVTLGSGSYMLYPIRDEYASSYAYRYFEKKDDGVYFKAFSSETGEIIEVENPVFIKKPLIVGESWETQPSIDLNSALSNSDLNLSAEEIDASIHCKMYVIGIKSIDWNSETVDPIRLDERSEANVSIPFNEDGANGTINMNLKMTNILYLLEDIGVIKQDMYMDMTIKVSISAEGQSGTINLVMNSKGNLNLDSYDLTGSVEKKSVKITDENGRNLKIEGNDLYESIINKSLKVSKIIKQLF